MTIYLGDMSQIPGNRAEYLAYRANTMILESIQVARKNWHDWRDVFEHGTPINTNPLLVDQTKFASFCTEYSVSRTIRKGTQNEFRSALERDLAAAIRADTGQALDAFEVKL